MKKHDISMGQYRWLTVTSAEGVAGVELVLEPLANYHRLASIRRHYSMPASRQRLS